MIPSKADKIIIRTGISGKRVHIPDDEDPSIPACVPMGRSGLLKDRTSWHVKDSSVIPDGFYEDCEFCVEVLKDS